METKFNFKSQIATDKNQSERLLALGLKKETADCHWYKPAEYEHDYWFVGVGESWTTSDIPAWSLHRLIELCPQQIYIGKRKYPHTLHLINNECVAYIDDIGDAYKYHDEGDLYNSLIKCIEWLIEEGYFNKEYLD